MNNNIKQHYIVEDTKIMDEVVISWIITHSCQEKCGYCISPNKTKEITSKDTHFLIQNHLIKTGLTKMRYIGGEPLFIPHLSDLIIDAFNKGINTRISTNGILLTPTIFNKIKNHLNSVAFPFESANDSLNESIRCTKHHREIITSRIKMIKEIENIGILINTCVHKENIKHLEELGILLSNLGVDHWKLRRFNSTSGRGALPNKERFEINDAEFFLTVSHLQKTFPNLKISGRMPSRLSTRLMLSPQGDLYRMVAPNIKNINYGNILKDNINIKEIFIRDNCT